MNQESAVLTAAAVAAVSIQYRKIGLTGRSTGTQQLRVESTAIDWIASEVVHCPISHEITGVLGGCVQQRQGAGVALRLSFTAVQESHNAELICVSLKVPFLRQPVEDVQQHYGRQPYS